MALQQRIQALQANLAIKKEQLFKEQQFKAAQQLKEAEDRKKMEQERQQQLFGRLTLSRDEILETFPDSKFFLNVANTYT